jgi:hypothetical protein
MKKFTISIILILLINTCFSQPIPTDSLYLGQTLPGKTPKIFPLLVSTGFFAAERIVISNDGKEIYYQELKGYNTTSIVRMKYYRYSGGQWTGPFNLIDNYVSPSLSITNDTMYIENNNNAYFSIKSGLNWSNPKRFLNSLNTSHYLQVTNNGNFFTSSKPSSSLGVADWCRLYINGTDTNAVSLGLPVNSIYDDLDFCVSRDETFMILSKPAGLFVSYHKNNGNWTNPKNLGSKINWGLGEWGPYVSSDNKYLFYSTGTNPNYSDTYIYWARIDSLIDSLKNTNFVPYLKNQIPNQTDTLGQILTYTFPDSTFIDDDGNNTLTYSATLSSGSVLPSWINFNPVTRTFAFTPTAIGSTGIKVTATDTANASVTCTFNLNVVDHTFIHESNGQIIKDYKLFQNFPNPFNPNTVISYSLFNNCNVVLKLYDVLGKEIATLVDSFQKTGFYDINLNMSKLNLSSGIYYYALSASELNSGKIFRETKVMSYIK